jgi:ribosome maturation factor RimP
MLVEPILEEEEYELVECSISRTQRSQTFRVSIDREDGVTIEACARISRALVSLLDTNPSLRGTYQLEVSSAGMNRPVWTAAHFRRFAGERVRVQKREGQHLSGTIGPLEGEGVWIRPEKGDAVWVALDEIHRAEVLMDPWRKKGGKSGPEEGADASHPAGKKRNT